MSDPRPRSTPIPGSETIIPGNAGYEAPTPAEFVQGATFTPPPPPGQYAPPPGARPPLPGMDAADAFQFVPLNQRKQRGCVGKALFLFIILIGPAVGVGAGIWAFFKARDAMDTADELSNPELSDRDRTALGVGDDVETLFEEEALEALVDVFEDELPGEPTRFTDITIYSDYAFATVQDPVTPRNLDRYQWRTAKVGSGSPQPSVADVEGSLFTVGDVDWDAVAQVVADATNVVGIDDAKVTHVMVSRSQFQPEHAAVIRVYVSGARGSGYIELAPDGEVLAVH